MSRTVESIDIDGGLFKRELNNIGNRAARNSPYLLQAERIWVCRLNASGSERGEPCRQRAFGAVPSANTPPPLGHHARLPIGCRRRWRPLCTHFRHARAAIPAIAACC